MAFLTQSRFPRLWYLYQLWAGGTADKRSLARYHLKDHHKAALEVGCSVGNIGQTFIDVPRLSYTGVDIDPVVIRLAEKKFGRRENARFVCQDLSEFAEAGGSFDYIILSGVLHHCDDTTCEALLSAAADLAAPGADIIILEPLLPESGDSIYIKFNAKLERGAYVKRKQDLVEFVGRLSMLRVEEFSVHPVAPTPLFSWPTAQYFGLFRCKAA